MEKIKSTNLSPQVKSSDRLVYLFTRDYQFAAYVSQQITHFGYYIQHVRDIKSLGNAIAEHHSVAILIDIPPGDNPVAENSIFFEISSLALASQTLIFISEQDNQVVRLKSIQAGGT
ncbi:MAG: hypothetical protein IH586_15465, partial [Anaerolineaceae bacterium]|nr:hypothetical protein [Anaerolineaceae bacterium]